MAFAQYINKENPNITYKDRETEEIGKDEKTKEITYFPQLSEDEKVVDYDEGPIPQGGYRPATPEEEAIFDDMNKFFGTDF